MNFSEKQYKEYMNSYKWMTREEDYLKYRKTINSPTTTCDRCRLLKNGDYNNSEVRLRHCDYSSMGDFKEVASHLCYLCDDCFNEIFFNMEELAKVRRHLLVHLEDCRIKAAKGRKKSIKKHYQKKYSKNNKK